MAASRALRRFPINLFPAKFRHDAGDFHGGPRGLPAAVDFIFQAALARLSFVIETQYDIDDGYAMINRDALECISDGLAQISRMVRLSLQNDSNGNDYICFFLRRQLVHNDRNFECPRHSLERNRHVRCKDMQFFLGVIDEALHVARIESARDDDERASPVHNAGTRRDDLRHFKNDEARMTKRESVTEFE